MQPNGTQQVDPAKFQRILMIIWGVLFVSIALMFLLAFFVAPKPPKVEPDNRTLTIVLAAIGTLAATASIFLRHKLVARAVAQQQPADVEQQQSAAVSSAYIIAFALCESAALFGVLIRFATNDHYYYLLFIVAVVFLVLNMPRRDDLINALPGKRI